MVVTEKYIYRLVRLIGPVSILESRELLGFSVIILLSSVASLLELVTFTFVMPFVNYFSTSVTNRGVSNGISLFGLDVLANVGIRNLFLVFIGAFIGKNLISILVKKFQFQFASSVDRRISNSVFESFLGMQRLQDGEKRTSEKTRTISLAQDVSSYTILPIILLFSESSIGLLLFCYMISINFGGTVSLSIAIILASATYSKITKSISIDLGKARFALSALNLRNCVETFAALREIQTMGRQDFFIQRFRETNEQMLRAVQRQNFIQSLPSTLLEIVLVGGLLAVSVAFSFVGNSSENTIAYVSLFAVVGFRLLPSAGRMLTAVQNIRYGSEVVNQIKELEKGESHLVSESHSHQDLLFSIRDVSVIYEDTGTNAIKSLSLEIRKGRLTGISGPSGSGKSTLMNLMLGITTPSSGDIKYFSQNNLDRSGNSHEIAFVPQDVSLISGTLLENIVFGLNAEMYSDVQLAELIERVGLNNLVVSLPNGLMTEVGEFGDRLSGGERQRVGIARALLGKPRVLFLDEPTSSLDERSESEIIELLRKLKGEVDIIVISHSTRVIAVCDDVINLA